MTKELGIPDKEASRLAQLTALGILDTPQEEVFDRLTELASLSLGMPKALISIVDDKRQWFKSRIGIDLEETPKEWSVCQHVVRRGQPLVVEDLRTSSTFSDSPLVCESPHLVFYAGHPLIIDGDCCIGSLCVLDTTPRSWSEKQAKILAYLAGIVVREMEIRSQLREAMDVLGHLRF
jgi:GAF domain-containing protein